MECGLEKPQLGAWTWFLGDQGRLGYSCLDRFMATNETTAEHGHFVGS